MRDEEHDALQSWGLKATFIYVILLFGGIPVAALIGWLELRSYGLNELGDFLAGAFGPLAFFWLVLGFFLQRKELKNSVEALNLQAKELKASVEQQTQMVEVTRETLQHEKEVLGLQEKRHQDSLTPRFIPIFKSSGKTGKDKFHFSFRLLNSGAVATDIEFHIDFPGHPKIKQSIDGLQRAESTENMRIFPGWDDFPTENIKLLIFYTNQEGRQMQTAFELLPPGNLDTDWMKQFQAVQISDAPML